MAVNMLDPWMEDVEERTGGTVTFDVQPGGALSPPDEVYENAAAGAFDMGWALHGYTPGRFPITRLVELPFVWDSAEDATDGLWDLYEEFPEFQEEFDDTQVIALWVHDIGDLFTTEQPVESPSDLEGLELRAPGPEQSNLVEALGGDAQGLPAPELFDALDGGVIDGLMIANSGLNSFDLWPTLEYATVGSFYVGAQYAVMNQGTWEELSAEQQQVIEETSGRELSLTGARAYDEIYEDVQASFEEEGLEVTELEGDELDEWIEATDEVPDEWMQDQDPDVPAEEMYERLLEISGQ
ncbi:TRAP transporter substrate-binding protein [Egibacter rhizosphaerae]|uniref:TRAP transporter substrate-binding protein n=2 Tax=Egibacter rhizosphaerae TaxID=1670831 RepID=A0A411YI71_9ACTN|nr:TRAP transporter substrate-binding protein [Egibacter rhizosphaerae]